MATRHRFGDSQYPGYLYVYVSNETPNIPVFFDNLQVTHTRGPLLEEDHYYPFGLQMRGICSKAAGGVENKFKFNEGVELDGDFGVDIYETFFRGYDAQIGRFRSVDPKAEMTFELSTFQFSGNNPVMYNDPLGDLFGWIDGNGNKWHGNNPLAGVGKYWDNGFGAEETGNSGGGGGGTNGATIDANGNIFFSGDVAGAFLNAYNRPNDFGEWGFSFGTSHGRFGYWTNTSYVIYNGDKEGSGKGFTSTGSNLNELVMGRTFVMQGINEVKKDLGAQSGGGGRNGYQLTDDFGQLGNALGVTWSGFETTGKYLRQNNGGSIINNKIGFGTQQASKALAKTVNTLGKWGKNLGTAGMVLSSVNYAAQGLDPNQTISTATHVNFWLSAGLYGAATIIGGPIIGGAALLYGIGQLGSYAITGNTLEENLLGK